MSIYIAGRDKPHRCVECWAAGDLPKWRRYMPRRCRNGHLTLTTCARNWRGRKLFGPAPADQPEYSADEIAAMDRFAADQEEEL